MTTASGGGKCPRSSKNVHELITNPHKNLSLSLEKNEAAHVKHLEFRKHRHVCTEICPNGVRLTVSWRGQESGCCGLSNPEVSTYVNTEIRNFLRGLHITLYTHITVTLSRYVMHHTLCYISGYHVTLYISSTEMKSVLVTEFRGHVSVLAFESESPL